jgi:hypothetical protein
LRCGGTDDDSPNRGAAARRAERWRRSRAGVGAATAVAAAVASARISASLANKYCSHAACKEKARVFLFLSRPSSSLGADGALLKKVHLGRVPARSPPPPPSRPGPAVGRTSPRGSPLYPASQSTPPAVLPAHPSPPDPLLQSRQTSISSGRRAPADPPPQQPTHSPPASAASKVNIL